jgi:hypothetical protein
VNSIQAVVDTIIAVSLCIMLQKSRTGFRQWVPDLGYIRESPPDLKHSTNAIINKLVRRQTGWSMRQPELVFRHFSS